MNLPIILMAPPPVDMNKWTRCSRALDRDPSYRASEVAKAYGDRARTVATHSDCLFLDIFEALGGYSETYEGHLRDGLHLSSSGNDLVFESLMKLLESQAPSLLPSNVPLDKYSHSPYPFRDRPQIVLLGDSLTEFGFNYDGWVARVASDYTRRADVLVRGFQGHNTKEAWLKFIDFLPASETGQSTTLFVTIWLGANDAFSQGDERHVPVDEYRENLVKMVAHLR